MTDIQGPHCDLPSPDADRPKREPVSGDLEIRIDAARRRFVAEVGGAEAFVEYIENGDGTLHLVNTWVPTEARGGGVGALLAGFALDHARAEGLKVTTSCWFIDRFLEEHPEYQELQAG